MAKRTDRRVFRSVPAAQLAKAAPAKPEEQIPDVISTVQQAR
jgi:hypothetical protein